ncbi:lipoxygenase [Medicago truncatula]|uniref:Lipoxygenase n=1 Tax=Medicago truncatula TaxID=3880 RepID=G7K033_MEDTR|nr:lipoxygenase [Medicago truncatula]
MVLVPANILHGPFSKSKDFILRDENFGHLKSSDFLTYGLKSLRVPIHLNLWMYRRSTPITKEHIEINLGGLALEEDQHECNGLCDKADLVLETSIIELSIPHSTHKPSCMQIKVLKLESTIWLLAKARVIVNDSCYHASTHKPLWIKDHVSLYYPTDEEVVEKGHGDLKDKQWWPSMQTLQDLIQSWSIIIWTTPALHANNYAKRALQAFQKFGIIIEEQNDSSFKNRYGPAQLPYTLPMLTFRGIPICNILSLLWTHVLHWLSLSGVLPGDSRQHLLQFTNMVVLPRVTYSFLRVIWFATVWAI